MNRRLGERNGGPNRGVMVRFHEYLTGNADESTLREVERDLGDPHSLLRSSMRFAVRRQVDLAAWLKSED